MDIDYYDKNLLQILVPSCLLSCIEDVACSWFIWSHRILSLSDDFTACFNTGVNMWMHDGVVVSACIGLQI